MKALTLTKSQLRKFHQAKAPVQTSGAILALEVSTGDWSYDEILFRKVIYVSEGHSSS